MGTVLSTAPSICMASLVACMIVRGVHLRFVQWLFRALVRQWWPSSWCARLQFHVSGASKPRLASSANAGNSGCSLRGCASSLTTSLKPCIGSYSIWDVGSLLGSCYILKPGRTSPLLYLQSLHFWCFLYAGCGILGNHPCGDKHGDELHVPCCLQVLGLEIRGDASDLSVNDSCVWLRSVERCCDFEGQIQLPKPVCPGPWQKVTRAPHLYFMFLKVLTGSVKAQMSVLAILLGVHLPAGGNERWLLWCLCCVTCGTWQFHALIGSRDHVGWPWLSDACMREWLLDGSGPSSAWLLAAVKPRR